MADKLSVLIVDDEDSALDYGSTLLRMLGHTVVTATNGHEAIARLQAGAYDVVVTDHVTVDAKGTSILKPIKELQPDAGVIVISGIPRLEDASKSFLAGAHAYLPKPFNYYALQGAIERALIDRKK